jgi:aspartate beta-hydroxylase
LRSRYLKQNLKKATQPYERREYFRIERALAGYLGEANVFSSFPTQRPKVIYVPGLGTAGFLDPQSHPIVPALRSAFRDVQAEFDEVMSDQQALEPFLGHAGGGALEGYVSGGEKASWDALFFFRHGRRFEASHRRCPRTSALLDSLDLCRINGQSPEICFSVLQPGSRIEPHFGVTNARVVVHLPLRVPAECHLALTEVGRHDWVEGEPMVFDDTFEHSALNPSGQPRGILLMDAWHPSLSMVEREAFSGLIAAISSIERDRFLPVEQENA